MNETFFDVELKKNQEYIINKILSVGGILAFSIVIVVFIRDFPDKINVYFFIEAFLTVFALFIALFNKMFSLMFKVIFIVLALYLTFATSLYSNGFATPSKAYFIVTPVLVSFILSFKRTMVLLAIFSFTYFMFSYLYIYNFIKITQFNNKYPQLFLTWLVDGTVYIVSSFCIIYIINLFKNFNFSKIHELFTLKETLQKKIGRAHV